MRIGKQDVPFLLSALYALQCILKMLSLFLLHFLLCTRVYVEFALAFFCRFRHRFRNFFLSSFNVLYIKSNLKNTFFGLFYLLYVFIKLWFVINTGLLKCIFMNSIFACLNMKYTFCILGIKLTELKYSLKMILECRSALNKKLNCLYLLLVHNVNDYCIAAYTYTYIYLSGLTACNHIH